MRRGLFVNSNMFDRAMEQAWTRAAPFRLRKLFALLVLVGLDAGQMYVAKCVCVKVSAHDCRLGTGFTAVHQHHHTTTTCYGHAYYLAIAQIDSILARNSNDDSLCLEKLGLHDADAISYDNAANDVDTAALMHRCGARWIVL